MTHQVRAVLFDFDGLLMDTESTNLLSWEEEWARWGLTLDRETFFVPHGGDVTDHRYQALADAAGEGFDLALSRRRRTDRRDVLNARLRLAPGIDGWLTSAAQAGWRTAVASSSAASWVEHLLDRVGALGAFELVVGGDSVARHKPSPDVYLLALERLGVGADEAVAVEDSPHGVAAAQAAGIPCIAIPNPLVDRERVAHADLVLSSAEDCPLHLAIRRATAAGKGRPRPECTFGDDA